MFQRIIDGISASTGTTVRLTSLAAGTAFALFITTCFLCAAAFISVLEKYGPVQACLAGAGVFFLLTLTAAPTTEASDPVPDNNIARAQTTVRAPCVVPRVVT